MRAQVDAVGNGSELLNDRALPESPHGGSSSAPEKKLRTVERVTPLEFLPA